MEIKERLVKLVCSDCGEQKLSSCSCFDETNPFQHLNAKAEMQGKEEVVVLKRSSSNCVNIKRHGFWRIGNRKKKNKDCGRSIGGFDEKSEMWIVHHHGGVSRSRSLCSFRGCAIFGSGDVDG